MKTMLKFKALWLAAALAGALSTQGQAQAIKNGGFESGFSGWTTADQAGSDGTFFVQSGTASPLNGFPVPAPPEGLRAAMTDAGAGGSHLLYQDFVVPGTVVGGSIDFSLFLNNGANDFFSPATLDWAATNQVGGQNLNQQARVDILTTSADPFSVASGDVLLNLFQTHPGDPLVSGYTGLSTDLSALLLAHKGETLRLRFAEVDNVSFFNFGVDKVNLSIQAVPEPSSLLLVGSALLSLVWFRRRPMRVWGVGEKPNAVSLFSQRHRLLSCHPTPYTPHPTPCFYGSPLRL